MGKCHLPPSFSILHRQAGESCAVSTSQALEMSSRKAGTLAARESPAMPFSWPVHSSFGVGGSCSWRRRQLDPGQWSLSCAGEEMILGPSRAFETETVRRRRLVPASSEL